jgi:transcriptional regulator with XRE-family HTH domain
MTNPFRHYLKEWRQRRRLSQAELALKLRTDVDQIGRWETNQHAIPMLAMFRLFRALDVTPQQFFLAPEEADADPPHFICPRCGAVSFNPHDVKHRYCGRCHAFVDDA